MKRIVFSLVLVGCELLFSCSGGDEQADRTPISVKTVAVAYCDNAGNIGQEFPFIAKPYRTSELSFRVGGLIAEMDLHSGRYFEKGSLIASIDPRDYRIRLDKAEAQYEHAEAEFRRVESLYRLDNLSAAAYEKAYSDYRMAESLLATARNELLDTHLTAPFGGYVQEVLFEQNQDVRPAQPICTLIDVSRLRIEIYVPQQIAVSMRCGDAVLLRFDALEKVDYRATIEEISKGTAGNNLSFRLTVIFDNGVNRFPAGISGRAILANNKGGKRQEMALPQQVVRNSPTQGTYVWTIDAGKAFFTPIRTGRLLRGGRIEIVDGLSCGTEVVATNIGLLVAGSPVSVIKEFER